MNSIDSLLSCHQELSNLANKLQYHRKLLINDPYVVMVQSSNTKPSNSFYFPYCSMVEQYIDFSEQYHSKLNEFKELLLQSLANTKHQPSEHNELSEHTNTNDNTNTDGYDSNNLADTIVTPTPSIMYDDTYLPTIDEDKETVYSYNSYNLSTNYSLITDIDSQYDDDNDDNDDDDDNDDEDDDDDSQYVYSDESDEEEENEYNEYNNWHSKVKKTFIFKENIYCNTLVYISMNGEENNYVSINEIRDLFVDVGGIDKCFINDIVFKRNYKGNYYWLVQIKHSKKIINECINNISDYSNNNNLNIVINIFKPSYYSNKYDGEYYLNMKQSNKLYITHFDILNGNIYYDLIKLLGVFGEIKNIEIFIDDNNENDPYAFVEFNCIRDAVRLFDAHNINMTVTGYCTSLYFAHRLLEIKYAN